MTPPVSVYSTNIKAAKGSSAALAFDGDVSTAFHAAASAKAGDFVSFVPAKGVTPRQVIVVGTACGKVQVRSGRAWRTIGTISDDAPFHAFAVPAGTSVKEVRLMLVAGSPAPVIREMTVVDRELRPTPTPATVTPIVTPTPATTIKPTVTPSSSVTTTTVSEANIGDGWGRLRHSTLGPRLPNTGA